MGVDVSWTCPTIVAVSFYCIAQKGLAGLYQTFMDMNHFRFKTDVRLKKFQKYALDFV